jgi:hypothetical protein
MRILSFLLAALVSAAVFADSIDYCADLGGSWTQNGSTGNWQNIQMSNGTITSGNFQASCTDANGVNPLAVVTGSYSGSGKFAVTLTWPTDPTSPCNNAVVHETVTIPLTEKGCGYATISPGTNYMTVNACMVPSGNPNNGENTTTFYRWENPDGSACTPPGCGVAHFQATLKPPHTQTHYNYSGRQVTELFGSPDPETNDCTPAPNFSRASTWDMHSNNTIDDYLGWANGANYVNSVRSQSGVFPCTFTRQQQMVIDCYSGGNPQFEQHTLSYGIEATTVTLSRNGTATTPTAAEVFGTPQQILRADYALIAQRLLLISR